LIKNRLMKSLHKALDVLEYVVKKDGFPSTPAEIADALGLNSPTCVRILMDWVQRGYLIQISRRTGYIPGPMMFTFTGRNWPYADLTRVGEEPVIDLSHKTGRLVTLSVINQGRKYILNNCNCNPRLHFNTGLYHDDVYETASGRILLALNEEKELNATITRNGFPGECWNGINSKEALKQELEKIRKENYVRFLIPSTNTWALARPVIIPGYPVAALGISTTEEGNIQKILSMVKKTVTIITRRLQTSHSVGL